mmetsp:Transcript_6603/g.24310  ORF Transcript_6603/g.24310 Transcript_6603/m.24310 type:complete len:205 (+) Transcript_6603:208-822(+)
MDDVRHVIGVGVFVVVDFLFPVRVRVFAPVFTPVVDRASSPPPPPPYVPDAPRQERVPFEPMHRVEPQPRRFVHDENRVVLVYHLQSLLVRDERHRERRAPKQQPEPPRRQLERRRDIVQGRQLLRPVREQFRLLRERRLARRHRVRGDGGIRPRVLRDDAYRVRAALRDVVPELVRVRRLHVVPARGASDARALHRAAARRRR